MLCNGVLPECKALLVPGGGSGGGEPSRLAGLLRKALTHAAGMLQRVEKYVSSS
jgi:hypothetical protein